MEINAVKERLIKFFQLPRLALGFQITLTQQNQLSF